MILKGTSCKTVITLWLLPLATRDNYHHPAQEVFLGLLVSVEDTMFVFTVRISLSTSLKGMTELLLLLFLCFFFS